MKIRNRILYYSILFVIILFSAYNLVQKALISPIIKSNIIRTVGPAIKADNFGVSGITVNLKGLRLSGIIYEKENVKVTINDLMIDFSLLQSLKDILKPEEKFFKARSVSVNGCSVSINPETRPDAGTKWRFEYEDFRRILEFLKKYDYVKSISINDVNLSYISDFGLQLINGMDGTAEYDADGNITLKLNGKFLDMNGGDISLKGFIDNSAYSADIDLDLGKNEVTDFKSPFGLYNIDKGRYEGKFKLEINKYSENKLYLSGNFLLSGLDMTFNDRIFLKNAGFDLSYFNGLVSLTSAGGDINGISFTGKGTVNNIMYPSGDIFFSAENVSGTRIVRTLYDAGLDSLAKDLTLGDDNSLELHFTDNMISPKVNFKLTSGAVKYRNSIFKDIIASGYYKSGEIFLKEAGFLGFNSVFTFSGKINRLITKSPEYDMNIKSTGLIFSAVPSAGEYLKSLSTITEGRIRGKYGSLPKLDAVLTAFDFNKKDDDKVFRADMILKDGIADITVTSQDSIKQVSGYFDLINGNYSVSGDDLLRLGGTFTGSDLTEKAPELFYEITGNRNFLFFRAGSSDPSSLLYGDLEAKFDLGKDKLETFANWMPGDKNIITKPANFRIALSKDTVSVSHIYFDSRLLPGKVTLYSKNKELSGNIEAYNFDFGRFFGIKGLTTNTDLVLKLRGNISAPYADLYVNENIIKFKDAEGDSIAVSAEAEAHFENRKIRVEKIIVYEGLSRIMTLSGNINDQGIINLNTYGEIPAVSFNPFFERLRFTGGLKYKAELIGGIKDISIRLKNSEITFSDGTVNGDRIEKIELITSEFDSTGVLVKKLHIDAGKYLIADAEGFIPYSNRSEIYVTGNFHGDLLGYLDKRTSYISNSSSECEGRFTVEGWYGKPKLKELELYILDGKFTPYGSHEGFYRIRSKLFMDENLNLDIVKLIMREASTDADITVENFIMHKDYGDIIIPGGINLGSIALTVGEEGIDFNAYRMMIEDDYGNFVLKGKKDKRFRIYKRSGNLVIDGKAYLRNARITYPFLKVEKKKRKKRDISFRDIFGDLELDVEIIPTGGNQYFYNVGTEESSIWKRFVRSISQLDNELGNVNISIASDSKGLIIKGNVTKPKELQYSGTVSGRNGTGNYSALSFAVEDVSIIFDGQKNIRGNTDPYLKASAKTSVKTKIDSTGYSGFETVWLKIVTKDDDGQIIDSEGARISNISIILVDEYGNSWIEKSGLAGIDTGGTAKEIFAGAVDTRIFSPILSPIENALGRFLGAQVSIRPNVSGNFIDNELGYLEIPENYAEYFVGSEFYISKFFTDNLALTWNSKYIGSEEYVEIAEREYGYKNNLGFDYRLNNYVFTSVGYQYDSIDNEYGYNLGLTYRYRFMNLSEPVDYIKSFLRLK